MFMATPLFTEQAMVIRHGQALIIIPGPSPGDLPQFMILSIAVGALAGVLEPVSSQVSAGVLAGGGVPAGVGAGAGTVGGTGGVGQVGIIGDGIIIGTGTPIGLSTLTGLATSTGLEE